MTPLIEGFVINKIEKNGVKDEYKIIGEIKDWKEVNIGSYQHNTNPITFYTNSGQCYKIKEVKKLKIKQLPEFLRKKCYAIMKATGHPKLFNDGVILVCCIADGRIDPQLMSECPMCKNSFYMDLESEFMTGEDQCEEMYTEIELKEQELGWDEALKDSSVNVELGLYDILMETDDFADLCSECSMKAIKDIDVDIMKEMIKEVRLI